MTHPFFCVIFPITDTTILCKLKILFPDPQRMVDLNYPKLAYCPFLIADDGSYPREANQYLRERSLAEWRPRLGQSAWLVEGRGVVQTRASREAMSRRLVEFFRWCDNSKKDWRKVNYLEDLLCEWQSGLLNGTVSCTRKGLSNGTVNLYVTEAAFFLTWAAMRGYREPFIVDLNEVKVRKSSGNHTYSGAPVAIQTRVGSLAVKPDFKMLPTNQEIEKWLHEVHYLRGPVKRLACETIVRTGLRITECVELQVTDIPVKVKGSWPRTKLSSEGLAVVVHIGNKGKKQNPGSLESVNPRTVYFPLDLAERIYHYITEVRTTLILRGIDLEKDKAVRQKRLKAQKPTHLWVGERYGLPFTSGMMRKAWKSVPSCPHGWHPHTGREFFAVETMVKYAKDLCESRGVFQVSGVNQLGWLDALLSQQVKVILSPLMGHISEDTTNIYLRKLKHRLVEIMGHPAIMWANICAEDGEHLEDE